MIAGNHEFYNNGDIAARSASWQKMFLPNVGYYHNKVVRIDNVDFILSTLWSRIPPADEFAIQSGMNDYLQILYNIDGRHKGDVLNAEYATELGNYIADSRITAWIYGHSHHSIDMTIGNTRLVSNPLGYVFCGENSNFNDSAVIEV